MLNKSSYNNFYRIIAFVIIMNGGLSPSVSVCAVHNVHHEHKKKLSKVHLSIFVGSTLLCVRDTCVAINTISPTFIPGFSNYHTLLFALKNGQKKEISPYFVDLLMMIVGASVVHGGLMKWAWDNRFVTTT